MSVAELQPIGALWKSIMKRRQLDGLVIYKLKVVKGDSNKSNFLDLLEIINNKVASLFILYLCAGS